MKTLTQITSSDYSEMAPSIHSDGRVIYTRKQNDAEDIFVHDGNPGDWVGGAGDQTRPQWSGIWLFHFFRVNVVALHGMYLFFFGAWDSQNVGQRCTITLFSPALTHSMGTAAYGVETLDKSDRIWLTKVDGSKTIPIKTLLPLVQSCR